MLPLILSSQFTHLYIYLCSCAAALRSIYSEKQKLCVCVGSYINTCQSLSSCFSFCVSAAAVRPSSSAALGGNRLVNQGIKPTDNLQEIPSDRRSSRELLSCLKEKWNNRLF